MLKEAIENIKDAIKDNNPYFDKGFCNVYQNPDVGIVLAGDVPVFPASELGDYFYLRLPNNVTFSSGTYEAIADSIKGIGLNATIVLVACVKNANCDVLMKNIVNTLQALCGENITLNTAVYNSSEVVRQELSFMNKEQRDAALARIPNGMAIVSVTFTYQIPFTFSNCIVNPCSC